MTKLLILLSLFSCRGDEIDKDFVLIHTYCRRLDWKVEIYECQYKDIKYLKDLSKFVFCHDKFFDRHSSTKSIYYMNKNHWSILRCKKVLKILLKLLEN